MQGLAMISRTICALAFLLLTGQLFLVSAGTRPVQKPPTFQSRLSVELSSTITNVIPSQFSPKYDQYGLRLFGLNVPTYFIAFVDNTYIHPSLNLEFDAGVVIVYRDDHDVGTIMNSFTQSCCVVTNDHFYVFTLARHTGDARHSPWDDEFVAQISALANDLDFSEIVSSFFKQKIK